MFLFIKSFTPICLTSWSCISIDTCPMGCALLILFPLNECRTLSLSLRAQPTSSKRPSLITVLRIPPFPLPHFCVSPRGPVAFCLISYIFVYLLSSLLDCELHDQRDASDSHPQSMWHSFSDTQQSPDQCLRVTGCQAVE